MVTRNVPHEPEVRLGKLFARHGLDIGQLDVLYYVATRYAIDSASGTPHREKGCLR